MRIVAMIAAGLFVGMTLAAGTGLVRDGQQARAAYAVAMSDIKKSCDALGGSVRQEPNFSVAEGRLGTGWPEFRCEAGNRSVVARYRIASSGGKYRAEKVPTVTPASVGN